MHRQTAALALALAAACPAAGAVGRLADVEIIDRATGRALPTHYWHGEYWVAGAPGSRYSIAIHSRDDGRLLGVTSVDGINVISGASAAVNQTGYVFDPRDGYEIAGWRKSEREVAAFEFTAAPGSYANRTGRPANIGVIGVALFRERAREPQPALDDAAPVALPAPPPGAASRAAAAAAPVAEARADAKSAAGRAAPAALAERLGTGHGAREASLVRHTDFERESPTPNEVIRIRYDSVANLMAMGVLSGPSRPPQPSPFPESPRYVPDPPGEYAASLR